MKVNLRENGLGLLIDAARKSQEHLYRGCEKIGFHYPKVIHLKRRGWYCDSSKGQFNCRQTARTNSTGVSSP